MVQYFLSGLDSQLMPPIAGAVPVSSLCLSVCTADGGWIWSPTVCMTTTVTLLQIFFFLNGASVLLFQGFFFLSCHWSFKVSHFKSKKISCRQTLRIMIEDTVSVNVRPHILISYTPSWTQNFTVKLQMCHILFYSSTPLLLFTLIPNLKWNTEKGKKWWHRVMLHFLIFIWLLKIKIAEVCSDITVMLHFL